MKNYKVLITTSGLGSRLGDITKYTNKALISLGEKPILSYLIELYPADVEIVITLGYFGDQVKNFLKLVYPKRKFTFVQIDPYQGPGSSLGYSMLQASSKLQCQFIFHASDTIVTEKPDPPKKNWVGGYKGDGSSLYRSFHSMDNKVQKMNDKGAVNPDFLHIGLIGVADYASFWKSLQKIHTKNPKDTSLSDVHVIEDLLSQGISFEVKKFTEWYDTGNVEGLQNARKIYTSSVPNLAKLEESIYFFDSFVVKYFFDKQIAKERAKRATILKGIVPPLRDSVDHFYSYKYIKGDTYSDVANPVNFTSFLKWSKKNLWKPTKEVSQQKFKEICLDFYHKKSINRINTFLKNHSIEDRETIINDETVPSIKKLFEMIDFNWLSTADQTTYHGDFILENVISTGKSFTLIDWRQNFGGLLKAGDVYYDLAKLNHNLIVNHHIISENLFTIKMDADSITCDILRKENLVQCQKLLFEFIRKEGYDESKVKVLTGIIWLNMSPLHHHPFDLFLFYFGKLYLWRALNEKQK